MNIGRIFIPAALALCTTWAIQYFFLSKYQTNESPTVSGQTFTAPLSQKELKPLNKEVDFIDEHHQGNAVKTVIDTDEAQYIFSNQAASLEQCTYKKKTGRDELLLMKTITPTDEFEREQKTFLVALNQKTPYWYELVSHETSDRSDVLVYKAQTDQVTITKTYTVYKNTFALDLELDIEPRNGSEIDARIWYPAPAMIDGSQDTIHAVFNNPKGSLIKKERSSIQEQDGWIAPRFFGSEDRFFLHILTADSSNFVQRAYYKLYGQNGLISILEGPTISKQTKWIMTFYFGPKQERSLSLVNRQLEDVLDYSGILAPIARLLIKLLNLLFSYVKNYGWAIVLLTLIINIFFLPFRLRSLKGMSKIQDMQKKLAYIEQRYKHDPEMMKLEKSQLIAKHGVPGLGGCLPLLAQIPIFFALNKALSNSLELYQAPFLWMSNLSAPDPYYILSLIIALSMIVQAFGKKDEKQQFMSLGLALVFGAFSTRFPAGLCLYIIIGSLFFAVEAWVQERSKKA